jgi:hypothetical protein
MIISREYKLWGAWKEPLPMVSQKQPDSVAAHTIPELEQSKRRQCSIPSPLSILGEATHMPLKGSSPGTVANRG